MRRKRWRSFSVHVFGAATRSAGQVARSERVKILRFAFYESSWRTKKNKKKKKERNFYWFYINSVNSRIFLAEFQSSICVSIYRTSKQNRFRSERRPPASGIVDTPPSLITEISRIISRRRLFSDRLLFNWLRHDFAKYEYTTIPPRSRRCCQHIVCGHCNVISLPCVIHHS